MPAFLHRRPAAAPPELAVAPVGGSPGRQPELETPRRTLKERLMSSYSGRSAPPTPEKQKLDPSDLSLPLQDPFSGLEAATERLAVTVEQEAEVPPVEEVEEVEEGLEVGEELELTPDPVPEPALAAPTPPPPRPQLPPAVTELLHPVLVCLLAVANLLLPAWLAGFLTGLGLTALAAYWLQAYLSPPVTHDRTPAAAASPIQVHEPHPQVEAWMNLLPHQFHPYDVDTYEVRHTVSVRVTIEHHMLKIEYPEWNIPKRLNTDEVRMHQIRFSDFTSKQI
jgi:hypothetical protein